MYTYVHGGDIYSEKLAPTGKPFIDFSANINPLGLPASVKKAVQESLKQCVNYPDPFCRDLRKATADFLNVKPEYLFFGNGAADCLFRLAVALKPKNALDFDSTEFGHYYHINDKRIVNKEIPYIYEEFIDDIPDYCGSLDLDTNLQEKPEEGVDSSHYIVRAYFYTYLTRENRKEYLIEYFFAISSNCIHTFSS